MLNKMYAYKKPAAPANKQKIRYCKMVKIIIKTAKKQKKNRLWQSKTVEKAKTINKTKIQLRFSFAIQFSMRGGGGQGMCGGAYCHVREDVS